MGEEPSTTNELSVADAFRILWDGRLAIIIATLAGALAAAGTFYLTRDYVRCSIRVLPRPIAENYRYDPMNRYFSGSQPDGAKPIPGASFLKNVKPIDDQSLVHRFIDSLRDGSILGDAALNSGVLGISKVVDESILKRKQNEFISSISFQEPLSPDVRNRTYEGNFWTISFTAKGKEKISNFATDVVQKATMRTRMNLEREAREAIVWAKADQAYKIADLKNAVNGAVLSAKQADTYRINHLNEQASIARSLDIRRNDVNIQTFNEVKIQTLDGDPGNLGEASVSENIPDYLRGYEALDREIEVIKARGDNPDNVLGTVAIRDQIRRLKDDQLVARAEQALDASPLSTGDFQAVVFNSGMVTINRAFSVLSTLVLPVLIGAFFGVCFVLVRALLAHRQTA